MKMMMRKKSQRARRLLLKKLNQSLLPRKPQVKLPPRRANDLLKTKIRSNLLNN